MRTKVSEKLKCLKKLKSLLQLTCLPCCQWCVAETARDAGWHQMITPPWRLWTWCGPSAEVIPRTLPWWETCSVCWMFITQSCEPDLWFLASLILLLLLVCRSLTQRCPGRGCSTAASPSRFLLWMCWNWESKWPRRPGSTCSSSSSLTTRELGQCFQTFLNHLFKPLRADAACAHFTSCGWKG